MALDLRLAIACVALLQPFLRVAASAPQIAKPSPYLPPLLVFENGTAVVDEAGWRDRRIEVSRLAQETFLVSRAVAYWRRDRLATVYTSEAEHFVMLPGGAWWSLVAACWLLVVLLLLIHSFLLLPLQGTYPSDVPPLVRHRVINTTAAGDGVSCTFIELTFDTSKGGGGVPTVTLPLEIIAPTDAQTRPVFMTQWNHRQWALEGVTRGYIGVVYPGSDAKDVAPLFQQAYPTSTFALITARAFVGSRCLDYILSHWPHVNPKQIALTGHSRNVHTTAYRLRNNSRTLLRSPQQSLLF